MTRLRGSRKGSSSVLVIMILLALVLFGTLALTSTYADLKLSRKGVSWLTAYYELDARGETFLAAAIAILNGARTDADRYFDEGRYLAANDALLDAAMQQAVRDAAIATGAAGDPAARERLYVKVFYHLAAVRLDAAGYDPGGVFDFLGDTGIFSPAVDAPASGVMTAGSVQAAGSGAVRQELDITLAIEAPAYQGAAGSLCRVVEWNQAQMPFEYGSGPAIWDGKVGN
jgi:hypothetical protein